MIVGAFLKLVLAGFPVLRLASATLHWEVPHPPTNLNSSTFCKAWLPSPAACAVAHPRNSLSSLQPQNS